MTTTLVTGATGNVGRHTVAELVRGAQWAAEHAGRFVRE
jgi:uncharacterized protein YbjT (DUF2867 family)